MKQIKYHKDNKSFQISTLTESINASLKKLNAAIKTVCNNTEVPAQQFEIKCTHNFLIHRINLHPLCIHCHETISSYPKENDKYVFAEYCYDPEFINRVLEEIENGTLVIKNVYDEHEPIYIPEGFVI